MSFSHHLASKFIALGAGCLLALLTATPLHAMSTEDPSRIQKLINAHLITGHHGPDVRFSAPSLDRPLNLPRCSSQPELFDPPGSKTNRSRRTIGVRCPQSWTFYVPVVVTQFANMVETVRAIGPGQSFDAADLRIVRRPISSMPLGYISDLSQVVGQLSRQPIAEGTLLRPTHLRAGRAVQRGQSVRIVLNRDGLTIESVGESLADGAVGAWVKVKNTLSGRIVEGRVESAGLVRVP